MQMSLQIACALNIFISVILGAYIFLKNWRSFSRRLFLLLCLIIAVSSFAFIKWLSFGSDFFRAIFWIKIYTLAFVFMPVVYFHLVIHSLDIKRYRFIIIYYLVSVYYGVLVLIDFFLVGASARKYFELWPDPKLLFSIFIATHLFILPVYLIFLLVDNYRKKISLKKLQIKYLIVSTILVLISWVSTIFLWYKIDIYPFGNFIFSVCLLIIAYMLSRQRLMDLRLVLNKIYIYGLLCAFIFLFYSLIYFIDISILDTSFSTANITIRILFALVFALAFIPFYFLVQKTGDYLFFKGYNPGHVIKDVLIKLQSVINIDDLLDVLADEFDKAIGTDKVGFLIFDIGENDEIEGFKYNPSINLSFIFQPSELLLQKLQAEKRVIIRSELSAGNKDIMQEMDFHQIKNIAPLIFKDRVIGLLIINNKISGESFNQEEVEFIEIMGRQASVAIVNSMLYKEVADLNEKLKLRFEKQTIDMKEKTEDLQDFFKISAFRLRSQLTDIKNILKKNIKNSSTSKSKKNYMKDSYAKALKSADIINDILQATEMNSADFVFEKEEVDLKKLLKKVCESEKLNADLKNIGFSLKLPKEKISKIIGNEKYLEQAIASLINNAIVYTFKGEVSVKAEEKHGEISISIKDTGIGISKNDIPKLFLKFSRAKNAVKAYDEGSGLGLYIVKQIIDAHPGATIDIAKTTLNRGTEFILKFPVAE
jgi:signal transduction histidine kinase